MSKLKELQAVRDAAWQAFQDEKAMMDAEVSAATKIIRDKYRESLDVLGAAYHEAEVAKTAEADRIALAEATAPYPVGTKLFEWSSRTRYGHPKEPILTGKVGIAEIWTPESVMPRNRHQRYSRPSVGRFVIRLLKADGSPSLNFIDRWLGNWYPEGKKPKAGR